MTKKSIRQAQIKAARDSYLSPEAETVRTDEVEVRFVTTSKGRIHGVCWVGSAMKPRWNFLFPTRERFDSYVRETVDSARAVATRRAEAKKARASFLHSLVEGDVLVSSWGYDQTNVDFYVVVSTTAKTVSIRKCGVEIVEAGRASNRVGPVVSDFRGPVVRRAVKEGNSVAIESYAHAYKFDARPVYATASGYGH